MTAPLVSVITPTYNRAGFIGCAIQSVLDQTFEDWELIVVDDGSEDNTPEIVASFAEDPRVRYFYQSNQGQSSARNMALAQARGQFIGFLDSDDIWFPEKLERQIAVFQKHPGVHIVHGDEISIDEEGHEISRANMRRYSGRITAHLLADNSVSITTALVRSECFESQGCFDTRYGVADDYELWLRFSAFYRFHYQPGLVAGYRIMENQISSDKKRRLQANERIIEDFLESHSACITPTEKRWGCARFYARKARYFGSVGERRLALEAIMRSLSLAPFSPVTWRGLYRVLFPRSSF